MSDDPEQVEFLVEEGDTATTIATRLGTDGLIQDPRAFVFIASGPSCTTSSSGPSDSDSWSTGTAMPAIRVTRM